MKTQKHKFSIPEDTSYLNCAYMGAMPIASQLAGKRALEQFGTPFNIGVSGFFDPVTELREKFARLIGAEDPDRIAVTCSASYGIATAARNIRPRPGSNIVVAEGQFPSNVYPWLRICKTYDCNMKFVSPPKSAEGKGAQWSARIIDAIDPNTAVVSLPPLFWSDGTLFDLMSIREKAKSCGAYFMVDGSQYVGTAEIDVSVLQPDALFVAGYKWLMAPYGTGMAYFGPAFDDGIPLEDNWLSYEEREDFRNLGNYDRALLPKALKYSSGEHPAQANVAVLNASIDQLLDWGLTNMVNYNRELFSPFESEFQNMDCTLPDEDSRAPHLIGIRFENGLDLEKLKAELATRRIHVSLRGDAMRISLHVSNDTTDLVRLLDVLKKLQR